MHLLSAWICNGDPFLFFVFVLDFLFAHHHVLVELPSLVHEIRTTDHHHKNEGAHQQRRDNPLRKIKGLEQVGARGEEDWTERGFDDLVGQKKHGDQNHGGFDQLDNPLMENIRLNPSRGFSLLKAGLRGSRVKTDPDCTKLIARAAAKTPPSRGASTTQMS